MTKHYRGPTLRIWMLCFVIINNVLFNLFVFGAVYIDLTKHLEAVTLTAYMAEWLGAALWTKQLWVQTHVEFWSNC